MASKSYKYFNVTEPQPFVTHVEINRPQKLNAFYESMWLELKTIFDSLSVSPDVRAIVLTGAGEKAFTAGLDVEAANKDGPLSQRQVQSDVARKVNLIKRHIVEFQDCIQSIEKCEKRTYNSAYSKASFMY
jgi:delta(3,5)-delta(2,4)-dienoyl-CoA isomerase